MSYNYTLANKIRTNLLLFTDIEIRSKIPNVNKIHQYYNNTSQIMHEELFYSNKPEDKNDFATQQPKINTFRNGQLKTPHLEKLFSQKFEKSIPKLLLRKQPKSKHTSSRNVNIALGNKNYMMKSYRKLSSTILYLKVGNTKKSAKRYLLDLCNSLILKTNLRKNAFSKKSPLAKNKKITKSIKKPRKIMKMCESNCSKNLLKKTPRSLDSFQIIVFGY